MYSASTALLEALSDAGVTHIFANFGSDHPALVEAIAEARAHGRAIPMIVTSPNGMVALSCAREARHALRERRRVPGLERRGVRAHGEIRGRPRWGDRRSVARRARGRAIGGAGRLAAATVAPLGRADLRHVREGLRARGTRRLIIASISGRPSPDVS